MRYGFIQDHLEVWPVRTMCRVLRVSTSGFYTWRRRPVSARAQRRQDLAEKAREIHENSKRTYGSPRVHRQLEEEGYNCNVKTVAKLMAANELIARQGRSFRPQTTLSDHGLRVSPNLLEQKFVAAAPNRVWVADITYVPTREGWLYLAVVLDVFSRTVVGWSMAGHMRALLVCDAFRMAIAARRPAAGLIHHSDRGVQYASDEFRGLLAAHEGVSSMSRKGNCYDNAMMEGFFGTLKREWVNGSVYATHTEARRSIFEYIETWYNRRRLHSSLGYVSPLTFEERAA